jgi:UDP-N-acetylmuramoyl-tripeptide--D-alanyl-D-alanine ligase
MLWTIEELVAVTGGTIIGTPSATFSGVSIDTRTLVKDDIFVAIKGDRVDGHDFVAFALKSNAGIAIVSEVTAEMQDAGALLKVPGSPLDALVSLGRAARARSHGRIIAITGSVGKTSTKDMLQLALSASGKTHASAASYNNHWGVPLSLARLPRDAAFGVFEIGMNHAGEITPLVDMVQPHVAIITTVAASHLGYFNSLDEIAAAKAEILTGLTRGGAALINRDNFYFDKLASDAKRNRVETVISFGKHPESGVRLVQSVLQADHSSLTVDVMGDVMSFKLGVPGAHMAQNALAVLGAVQFCGADLARAGLALAHAQAAYGRGVVEHLVHPEGVFTVIDESYNANPVSMRAALDMVRLQDVKGHGRRIAVLGDMLELGVSGPELHRALAEEMESIDLVFLCGPLMKHLWEQLPEQLRATYAAASDDLAERVALGVRAGDVVMVKGSLGSRMKPVVETLRVRFGTSNRKN